MDAIDNITSIEAQLINNKLGSDNYLFSQMMNETDRLLGIRKQQQEVLDKQYDSIKCNNKQDVVDLIISYIEQGNTLHNSYFLAGKCKDTFKRTLTQAQKDQIAKAKRGYYHKLN